MTVQTSESERALLSFSLQKSEKGRLLQERSELEQNLEETRQNLCGLCKSVSIESASDQVDMQLLTKLTAPDVPLCSPSSVGKDAESQITIEMVRCCSSVCDPSGSSVDAVPLGTPEASTQTEETGSPHSCPVPASLFSTCLDIDNSL